MKRIKSFFSISVLLSFSLAASSVFAQTSKTEKPYTESTAFLIAGVLLFAIAILFASIMIFNVHEQSGKESTIIKKRKVVSAEADLLLDHEYDGIRELDNKLPAWFMTLFYGSIIFGIIYMINFHLLGKQNLMQDEYNKEMVEAQSQKDELMKSGALINFENVTLLTDPADITKGKETFASNCVPCHGNSGEGTVGPNLTDEYWIHGGGIKNVFKTISDGVPAKGMISWKAQMNPKQIQQTASFVLTLQGTKPANGKAPEGQIYIDTTKTENGKTDSLKTKK
jgi:cytochrome c oxidase cbb3-type subunit III